VKILVAADLSPAGIAAVAAAAAETRLRDSELLIVDYIRAAPASRPAARYRAATSELDDWQQKLEREGRRVRVLRPLGVSSRSSSILRIAQEEGVSLIVLGLRPRSRVGKALLGSTAQEVLLQATCPVLAVKA
jgi:nucleotide-binding universal stress UspA family protein